MTQACLVFSFIRQYFDSHGLYKFPEMEIFPYKVLVLSIVRGKDYYHTYVISSKVECGLGKCLVF